MENSNEKEDMRALIMVFVIWLLLCEKNSDVILNTMKDIINSEPLAKIDYVQLVNADSIEPLETAEGRVLVAMAVYIGKTRLIDNFIVEV